jgi:hypothetical protein
VPRYLVVANRTLGGEHLTEAIRERMAAGRCSFHVVVPATPPDDHVWTESETQTAAQERLDLALAKFHGMGADADGEVGDQRPLDAIADAVGAGGYDEIILSTFPPGISRWLRLDLLHRVQHTFGIPVTHVVSRDVHES